MDASIIIPGILLLSLLVFGVPVAYTLLISGAVGLILSIGLDPAIANVQIIIQTESTSFLLAAIPMFLLMATLMTESKISDDLFETAATWSQGFPAGLPIAATLANGGMAVLSGSSTASAAATAKMAVPEMADRGYDLRIALGTVSAAGTFATMLPPSIALILYGLLTNTSIAELFIAGIIPGIITIVGYAILLIAWVKLNPPDEIISSSNHTSRKAAWKDRIKSLRSIWSAVLLALFVLVSIYTGIVTPSEAGAFGVAGALVLGFGKGMDRSGLSRALEEATEITAMIFMILIGAYVFSSYLSTAGVTGIIVDSITSLPISVFAMIVLILCLYILLGMIMDALAALMMTIPLTYPVVVGQFGYDPIWFGILLIKTIEIGLITPPFGLNVFVATGAVDRDPDLGFKGAIRFLLVDLLVLVIILVFPETVLWLVETMR